MKIDGNQIKVGNILEINSASNEIKINSINKFIGYKLIV